MRALILAGGKGSRLRPFTFSIPKPLVPIGDLPIIEILIRQLAGAGSDRITISVGHMAALIRAFCGDGGRWGVPIDYVEEDRPLGTAGCLGLIADLGDEPLLVVNGDTLTDMDWREAYEAHDPGDAITICANSRKVPVDFGVLEADADGRLTGYVEKPTLSYTVSMGVNIVSPWAVQQYVTPGERIDFPDLVRDAAADGSTVRVRDTGAYWLDLGRMSDLEQGGKDFEADPARFLPR